MDKQTVRTATVNRTTRETDIRCTLCLDGSGRYEIDTGIGFFDHMLSGFARHGLFDLTLTCKGDLEVDSHHTIEDCGIVLGECIRRAVGDKKAIRRFGHVILPMDEALILCAVDLSGRPYYQSGALSRLSEKRWIWLSCRNPGWGTRCGAPRVFSDF